MKDERASIENKANQMKEKISNIKDRNLEMMQREEERDLTVKRNERALQELPDSIRKSNIGIRDIPRGEGEGNREPIQTNNR